MYGHMRYDPSDPASPTADRLVLSEGHACPIVYAAGSELGLAVGKDSGERRPMTVEDAMTLRDIDSEIDGHPNPAEGFPFFPAATGSLGQGLSIAAGLAAAARLDGSDKRVFCIIGDGESREGQVWEAIDFIVDYGLNAVCPIFNCNGYGQSDPVSAQQSPEVIAAKLRGAGFDVAVIDGHDPVAVRDALLEHARHADDADSRPFAIVAETVKGWGFVKTAGDGLHGKPLTGDDEAAALKELEETAASLGVSGSNGDLKASRAPATASPSAGCKSPPGFVEAMNIYGQAGALADGKFAPRKGYGIALRALGHTNPDVVALDGDVKNSTFAEYFSQDPDLAHRFFECRIAEQHLISCAAGLASGGKIPFASSFGEVRGARVRPVRDGLHQQAQHQGRRLPRRSEYRRRRAEPDGAGRRGVLPVDGKGAGRRGRAWSLHPQSRGRGLGVRADRSDGGARGRLLPPRRKAGHAVPLRPRRDVRARRPRSARRGQRRAHRGVGVRGTRGVEGEGSAVGGRHQGPGSSTCTPSRSTGRPSRRQRRPAAARS